MEADRKAGKLAKGVRMAGRSAGRPRTHRDNKPTLKASPTCAKWGVGFKQINGIGEKLALHFC
jgi:hypothetical protein